MTTTTAYKAPENLRGVVITPSFVRDEMIACFESANREFLELLNQTIDSDILRSQIRKFVITVFANCGSSYWNPTKESIVEAITQCKVTAEEKMGAEGKEIIRHHYEEIMKLVSRLP
jgi:hypothetical protein